MSRRTPRRRGSGSAGVGVVEGIGEGVGAGLGGEGGVRMGGTGIPRLPVPKLPRSVATASGRRVARLSAGALRAGRAGGLVSREGVGARLRPESAVGRASVLRAALSTAPARSRAAASGVGGALLARSGREAPAVRGAQKGWAPSPPADGVARGEEYLQPKGTTITLPPRVRHVAASSTLQVGVTSETPGPGQYDPRTTFTTPLPHGTNGVLPLARPTYGAGAGEVTGGGRPVFAQSSFGPGPGAYRVHWSAVEKRAPSVPPFSAVGLGESDFYGTTPRSQWTLGGKSPRDALAGPAPPQHPISDRALARPNASRGRSIVWSRGGTEKPPGKGSVWERNAFRAPALAAEAPFSPRHLQHILAQHKAALRVALGPKDPLLQPQPSAGETAEKKGGEEEEEVGGVGGVGGGVGGGVEEEKGEEGEVGEGRKERRKKRKKERGKGKSVADRVEAVRRRREAIEAAKRSKAEAEREALRMRARRTMQRKWLMAVVGLSRTLWMQERLQATRAQRLGKVLSRALGISKERCFGAWREYTRKRKLLWASLVFRKHLLPALAAFRLRRRRKHAKTLRWFIHAAQHMSEWKRRCREYYARALRAQRVLHHIRPVLAAQLTLLRLQWDRAVVAARLDALRARIASRIDRSRMEEALSVARRLNATTPRHTTHTPRTPRTPSSSSTSSSSSSSEWERRAAGFVFAQSSPKAASKRSRRLSVVAADAMAAAAKAASLHSRPDLEAWNKELDLLPPPTVSRTAREKKGHGGEEDIEEGEVGEEGGDGGRGGGGGDEWVGQLADLMLQDTVLTPSAPPSPPATPSVTTEDKKAGGEGGSGSGGGGGFGGSSRRRKSRKGKVRPTHGHVLVAVAAAEAVASAGDRAGPTSRTLERRLAKELTAMARSPDLHTSRVALEVMPGAASGVHRKDVAAVLEPSLRPMPDEVHPRPGASPDPTVLARRRRRRMSVELVALQGQTLVDVPEVDQDIRDAALRRVLRAGRQAYCRRRRLYEDNVRAWDDRLEEELSRAEQDVIASRSKAGAAWEGQHRTSIAPIERDMLRHRLAKARPKPPIYTPLPPFEDMLVLVKLCTRLQQQRDHERFGGKKDRM